VGFFNQLFGESAGGGLGMEGRWAEEIIRRG